MSTSVAAKRLSLQEMPADKAAVTEEAKTLFEATYYQLREDIIAGRYQPGEKLRLEHLKSTYNVSAGTLREAVALLVSDALVTAQAQRGFRVAPMSIEDLEDLTRSRVLVECAALRESIEQGDDVWEANLVGAYHRLSRAEERLSSNPAEAFKDWEQRNREFHSALLAACTSQWLPRLSKLFYQLTERYRRISAVDVKPKVRSREEHQKIFAAAIARDVPTATREMENHIHYSLNAIRNSDVLASLSASQSAHKAKG